MSRHRWITLMVFSVFLLMGSACSDPMATAHSEPPALAGATSDENAIDDVVLDAELATEVKKDVPYVPTPQPVVERMLELADLSGDELLYDLGSGDGRIVITAAKKYGVRGVGIDIDPQRIKEANEGARQAGVTDKVKFIEADLFETDLRPVTALTLYLLSSVNLKLRPKILDELRPGTPVVSHDFSMGEWEPDEHLTMDRSEIFLWIVPAKVAGTWSWKLDGGQERTTKIDQEFQKISGESGGVQLADATLRGDEIGFTIRSTSGGRESVERYQGRVKGDVIEGTVEIDGSGRRKWSARKAS